MKKILALFACLAVFTTAFFAEPLDNNDFMAMKKFEEEKVQTITIIPEEQHVTDKNAKVWIEYNPAYHEAHFYYDTLYVTYDTAEALNTLLAVREDFMKEKNYKKWHRLDNLDNQKYYKDDRGKRGQMIQYLKFEY